MKSTYSFVLFALVFMGGGLALLFSNITIEFIDKGALTFALIFTGVVILFILINGHFQMKKNLEKFNKSGKRKPTQRELKEREQWAGKLEIEDQQLIFTYAESQQIKIKISEIKVIGEFTADADVTSIDWFLTIVKKDNEVINFPAYAAGLQETLAQLSKILDHEIVPKLFASVTFDSNVIYPKSIDGKKLFHFNGLRPTGTWAKIKVNLGFSPITPVLRNEIKEMVTT